MTPIEIILLLVVLIACIFCYMWKCTELELINANVENIKLRHINNMLEQCHVELLREIEKLEIVCKFNEECGK